MQRISAPGATSDRRFTNGDSSQGTPSTVVDASWLNGVQEEIAGAIEGYNFTLDAGKPNQLLGVLRSISAAIATAKNQVTSAFQQADSQLRQAAYRRMDDADAALKNQLTSEFQQADSGLSNRIDAIIRNTIPQAIAAAKSELYPVDSLYFNYSNGNNPRDILGFGSWSLLAQDRMLIGAGNRYSARSTGGAERVSLGIENIDPFNVSVPGTDDAGNSNHGAFRYDASGRKSDINVRVGGGQSHDNMPPWLAVYIWRRTS